MTNLEDAVKRLAAYSAMRADAKVDAIGPKGGIKRVPASDGISILDDGTDRHVLLHSDLKAVLARAVLAGDDVDEQPSALDEIRAERARQDAKWGPQNHPDGTGLTGDQHGADHARKVCQQAAAAGTLAWRHILREEVNEAFAEADPAKLREELVQVAAVAVAWIEAIDRRHKPEQEDAPAVSGWPPRAGDVWLDRDGDLWFATDMNAADDPTGPCIEFVSTRVGDHEDPDEARRLWGPIGLVFRGHVDQPSEAAK